MKRKWKVFEKISDEFIAKFPDYDPVILQLLHNRGMRSAEEFKKFLDPRYESLGSPFILSGMFEAVERLFGAAVKNEKITIYADYDADAVTACAVLYRALKKIGLEQIDYYIPDRFTEGYGLNAEAVEQLVARGTKLIITVDCGINAISEIKAAQKAGVDVIVTDHHHITDGLPDAVAVVNPKRDSAHTELDGLTGVGVAFKFVTALMLAIHPEAYKSYGWILPEACLTENCLAARKLLSANIQPHWEKWLLDFVAIGTVADCQSLMGENRILVRFGLQVMEKTKWPGLKELLVTAGVDGQRQPDTFTIGFIIAPRINAAGRIQHADVAFRLLICDDPVEVKVYAGQLESLNAHRQRLTEQVVSDARTQILEQLDRKLLVAVGRDWPKGIVGLVASKLADEFYRPTVVLEQGSEVSTGSARSIAGFSIIEAFTAVSQHLERYGGHAQAAGLTVKNEKVGLFHQYLLEYVETNLSADDLVKVEEIDAVVDPSQVTEKLVDAIKRFQPFGSGNPAVRFLFNDMVVENLRTVGSSNKHLKLSASHDGRLFKFIGFNFSGRSSTLSPGDKLDIIAEPSENVWNGRSEIQMRIVDMNKISS